MTILNLSISKLFIERVIPPFCMNNISRIRSVCQALSSKIDQDNKKVSILMETLVMSIDSLDLGECRANIFEAIQDENGRCWVLVFSLSSCVNR